MSRGETAAVLAALEARRQVQWTLAEVELDDGTHYLTNAYRDVLWNGHTYRACGHYAGHSDVQETSESTTSQVDCELSGVDMTYISEVLSKDFINRPLRLRRAWVDENGAVIPDPVLLFAGVMDAPGIAEELDDSGEGSGTSIITLSATNHRGPVESTTGWYTNPASIQAEFADDEFFEFSDQVLDELKWGKA